jgi:hypothetical protein
MHIEEKHVDLISSTSIGSKQEGNFSTYSSNNGLKVALSMAVVVKVYTPKSTLVESQSSSLMMAIADDDGNNGKKHTEILSKKWKNGI